MGFMRSVGVVMIAAHIMCGDPEGWRAGGPVQDDSCLGRWCGRWACGRWPVGMGGCGVLAVVVKGVRGAAQPSCKKPVLDRRDAEDRALDIRLAIRPRDPPSRPSPPSVLRYGGG